MKFKMHGILLSLFSALTLCLSFSIEASAHEYTNSVGTTYEHSEDVNISAADVDRADEAQMKKFVRHLATHLDLIQKDTSLDEMTRQERSREIVIFARDARQEGPLNNGVDIYVIGVTPRGAITNHGLHQSLYGYTYDSSQDPLQTLLGDNVPPLSDNVDPLCATYDDGNRVACAVRQETPVGLITTITGFHHAEDDPVAQAPNCDDFTFTVTAKRLEDETNPDAKKELLKQYVQEVIAITKKLIQDTAIEVSLEKMAQNIPFNPLDPGTAAEITARFYEKAPCFRKQPDLRYGSIYAFIMDPIRGVAFLSGNDFTRNGQSVSLNDEHEPIPYDEEGKYFEPNILTVIHRTLTDTPPPATPNLNDIEHGDNGFFRYHWAHPVNTELNTPDFLDRGVVPGRAVKESYIQVENLNHGIPGTSPLLLVFGSGFYPDDLPPEDDDDGCSIAATGNTSRSALLNLFLIASVLFSAVFLRKRS